MLFTMLPTAAVVVAVWAGAPGGPHAPDAMPELRKSPKPPIQREAALPAPPRPDGRTVRITVPGRG